MSGPRMMAAASGLVVALAAVPLAPIHAQGQISQLSQDSKLIFQMASSNIMEVRLGQMAQQKATNAAVKQFGQQMATDHTNLENQLTGLVSKNGTNFQPGMSKENEAEVSRLEKLSGAQFDQQYMTSMIQHHQQDISTLQSQGQSAKSGEARQMIAASLPVLQQHLTLATQVGGQVGANGGVAVATQPYRNPTGTTTSPTQNPPVSTQPGQVTTQGDISADMGFVREAASGNLMEIQLGQLAQNKASNPAVKQFAQRMVADHNNLENQLTSVASSGGQSFTPTMDSRHQNQINKLQGLSGAEFDRNYMSLMIRAHQRDVNNFQTQSQSANSAQVRTLATNSLPVLQQHLSLAQQVGAQVGADSTGNYAGGNGGGGANGDIKADAGFIREVNSDNQMQIQLAQLARQRSKNPQVRQFAEQAITDHNGLQNQWTAMASKNGMTLNQGLGPLHKEKITNLKKVNDKNFDKAYMVTMIQQYSDETSYWQKEGRASQSAQVRQLVNAGLPTLEQNFNEAKRLGRELGIDPNEALKNRQDVAKNKGKNNEKND